MSRAALPCPGDPQCVPGATGTFQSRNVASARIYGIEAGASWRMYGAVVVEPREGYPTKVDREYVVIQSEFYAKPDPARKIGKAPLYVLDTAKLRSSQPTHTVFNGVHNGMVRKPLMAKPGERVRLFVLNVGPSKTSSFHIVGTIFDNAYPFADLTPGHAFHGVQTVTVPAGGGGVFDVKIDKPGLYPFVSHAFAAVDQGQVGLLKVGNVAGTMSH